MLKKIILILMLLYSLGHAEVSFLPLFNGYIGHGNVFYEDKSGNPSINYDIDFVPAVVLSNRTSILPRIGSVYTGTLFPKEIQEEGDLYLQLMDTLFFLKWIHKRESGIAYRVEAGVKQELARETADEEWGKGLYDFQSTHGELCLGKKFNIPLSIKGGVRYFQTVFPNYQSLSSEQGLELQGTNVLDTTNLETFVNLEWYIGNMLLKGRASIIGSDYTDQKVVTDSGEYSAVLRHDNYSDILIGLNHTLSDSIIPSLLLEKKAKVFVGISLRNRAKASSQNHYFAQPPEYHFTPNYYNYSQTDIIPSITLKLLPSNVSINLLVESSRKDYSERLVQDVNGDYSSSGEKVYQVSNTGSLKVSFPVLETW